MQNNVTCVVRTFFWLQVIYLPSESYQQLTIDVLLKVMKLQPVSNLGGHYYNVIWRAETVSLSVRKRHHTCDIFDVLSVGTNRVSPASRETAQVKARASSVCYKRSDMGSIDVGASISRCCRPRDIKASSAVGKDIPRGMAISLRKQRLCVDKVLGSRRRHYATERPHWNVIWTNLELPCYSQRNYSAFAHGLCQL